MGKKTSALVNKYLPLVMVVLMLSSAFVVFDSKPASLEHVRLVVNFGKNAAGQEQVFADNLTLDSGDSSFDVLIKYYRVTPEQVGSDVFVKGVNGLENRDGLVWRFYVNNVLYAGPVSSHIPKDGDVLVFAYVAEELSATRVFG
ncbi:MAG: DUF4430 domain-containing protein [Nanoarchaeota archaeon]|nr:DUF4430 domain-containing protein [Nanoarchaeota archaeon]